MATNKYTKEYLIKILQDKALELGNTPTVHDMNKVIPNARYNYLSYFSSWDDAIKSANLPKRQKTKKSINSKKTFTKAKLISILQSKAKELNKTPSALELQDVIPNTWYTFARHFGSFNNAIKEAGLTPTIEFHKFTKEELIQILKDKYNELGKIPTSDDMINPNKNLYIQYFGSWNNALKESGLKISQTRKPKRNKSNAFKNYTKEQMITFLKDWASEHNNTLPLNSFANEEYLPSPTFVRNKLEVESWKEVKTLVEIHKHKKTKITIKEAYSNHLNYFKALSDIEILKLLEIEFKTLGNNISKKYYDSHKSRKVPYASHLKMRFNMKWEELLETYFNDDGTLKKIE